MSSFNQRLVLKQKVNDSIFYLEEILKYQSLEKSLDSGTEVAYLKCSLETLIEVKELLK